MDKISEMLSLLKSNYPNAKYYLNFSNTLELMVAAIMSAQVRDEVVNATTPRIFAKYKTAEDYSKADPKFFAEEISHVTFSAMKTKNIIRACKILVEKHHGKVPDNMEDLIELPGIGRKTANVILINAFGKVEGIPTDTHVIRVSFRLGWTSSKKTEEIEKDLMKIIPKGGWKNIANVLKAHGRAVCQAPTPHCSSCFLEKICPKNGVTKKL
jgi:endonuclease III